MKWSMIVFVLAMAACGKSVGGGYQCSTYNGSCTLQWQSYDGEDACLVSETQNGYEATIDEYTLNVVILNHSVEEPVFSFRYPDALVSIQSETEACTSRNDVDDVTPPYGSIIMRDGMIEVEGYLTCEGGGWRYIYFRGPIEN